MDAKDIQPHLLLKADTGILRQAMELRESLIERSHERMQTLSNDIDGLHKGIDEIKAELFKRTGLLQHLVWEYYNPGPKEDPQTPLSITSTQTTEESGAAREIYKEMGTPGEAMPTHLATYGETFVSICFEYPTDLGIFQIDSDEGPFHVTIFVISDDVKENSAEVYEETMKRFCEEWGITHIAKQGKSQTLPQWVKECTDIVMEEENS